MKKCRAPTRQWLKDLGEGSGVNQGQAVHCILAGVKRLRGAVFRKAMAVGKGGVFFLQMAAVGQQNAAQISSARGGVHPAFKAVSGQNGQIPTVIQVGVGQHHRLNVSGRNS